MKKIQFFIKSILDFVLSFFLLILLSPLVFLIALLIKIDSKGSVFYFQERAGKNKKLFRVIKFRTMVVGAEKQGLGYEIIENDERITKIGKILRCFCLDELPQLFNVLMGEMSLVGPRPTLLYQVENYTSFQLRRLEVKPGMTGWAQVNGRNLLSWEERIKLDIFYIDHFSLFFDLKILFLTVKLLMSSKGVYGQKKN